MYEYNFFDGDYFITFDIVEINDDNETVLLAISDQGRITQDTFDLSEDEEKTEMYGEGRYFKYGLYQDKIYINDFACM